MNSLRTWQFVPPPRKVLPLASPKRRRGVPWSLDGLGRDPSFEQLLSENPGWLFDIRGYTPTQLYRDYFISHYRDYNKPFFILPPVIMGI